MLSRSNNLTDAIGNINVAATAGSWIRLDGSSEDKAIRWCDDWDRADFRWPDPVFGEARGIACNVHVTGRTRQMFQGVATVRVQIEWVRDDEPSTFTKGRMYFESAEVRCGPWKIEPDSADKLIDNKIRIV